MKKPLLGRGLRFALSPMLMAGRPAPSQDGPLSRTPFKEDAPSSSRLRIALRRDVASFFCLH
jgi:hypothetical protein